MKPSGIMRLSDKQARRYLEKIRWPRGPVCPRCAGRKVTKVKGKRDGLYRCKVCPKRPQFTVTVGTIFEGSHIPLSKWVQVFYLMCSSKKGISAHQIHRTLGITYKSAWFMCHRVRQAMKAKPFADKLRGAVEVDEAYFGGKKDNKRSMKREGRKGLGKLVAAVQRGGGVKVQRVERLGTKDLKAALDKMIDDRTVLISDGWQGYTALGDRFIGGHEALSHRQGVHARGWWHTNSVEGFFSLMKRGVNGTFHHISTKHLQRYADEFAFRYSRKDESDVERTEAAIAASGGSRLKLVH